MKSVKVDVTVELEVPEDTTVEELIEYTKQKLLPVNFWGSTKRGDVRWNSLVLESIREEVKHNIQGLI